MAGSDNVLDSLDVALLAWDMMQFAANRFAKCNLHINSEKDTLTRPKLRYSRPLSESQRWPQSKGVRLETKDGRLYFSFQDGDTVQRRDLGPVPANWPKDMIPSGKKRYGRRRSEHHLEIEYHKAATWKRSLVADHRAQGEAKRRKYDHWVVTIVYTDEEKFCRVYKDHEKALGFAERQRKSPVVKMARVTQVR
jgi:hypothetical protein